MIHKSVNGRVAVKRLDRALARLEDVVEVREAARVLEREASAEGSSLLKQENIKLRETTSKVSNNLDKTIKRLAKVLES
ncbi:MAG: hypothetical protein KAJ75_01585 [Alphaproteobacteria bacterium]|nr:hypothetical protein [Alphaproteobacteria bacterium]